MHSKTLEGEIRWRYTVHSSAPIAWRGGDAAKFMTPLPKRALVAHCKGSCPCFSLHLPSVTSDECVRHQDYPRNCCKGKLSGDLRCPAVASGHGHV